MRFYLSSLLFLFVSCAPWSRSPSSAEKIRHVVFDIDWTITSEVKPDQKGPRVIAVEGKKYFVQDGIEDFIENLLRHENVKVSFFSGGSYSRNHMLLANIKLSDGRSLESVAHKILNREDLTPVMNVATSEKFFKRYKKDLTKVSPDLSELVMIDDTEHFVLNANQEEHVIYLGKTYEHFDSFKEAAVASGDYVPKTESEWSFARKKMMILNGAFHEALKETEENGLSFSEAVLKQTRDLDLVRSDWNDYSNRMYKISLAVSGKAKIAKTSSNSCVQLFSAFLAE